ncbi:MAG: flavodoxin [Bacilli bacterium]|nr:flavodoxin [Bacilli bacterium]
MFSKENYKDKKSIVIYFSRADENYAVGYIDKGNTEVIAEYIRELINADMFKVEPKIPYAKYYDTCTIEAKERQASHNAPITHEIPDLTNYEVIYVGTPVYWGDMPEELVTALKDVDFSGKTIRPFTTHEGSGLGNIPNQIKQVCRGGNVTEGLALWGASVSTSRDIVEGWI